MVAESLIEQRRGSLSTVVTSAAAESPAQTVGGVTTLSQVIATLVDERALTYTQRCR